MEKEFVPYELALRMKELGFDEPCMSSRDMNNGKGLIQLPLYQQAFRWFREKYGYYYEIFVDDDKTFGFMISYFIEIGRADKPIQRMYTTYEEAELACLEKLLEIVESKKE